MTPSKIAAKADSLSATQRSYLGLVAQGKTSKQIAQLVSGSYHTVNVEIGIAMRVLGVKSRHEAAALVREINNLPSYEGSYEQPALADEGPDREGSPHDTGKGRTDKEQGWGLPGPPWAKQANTLTIWQRIGWTLVIASSIALLLGGLVSGIASLLVNLDRLT